MSQLKDICIDCADPMALAQWWAPVLEYRVFPHREDVVGADPIDGVGPRVWFNRVPEPKTVKNRVHIDIYGDVDDLLERGATLLATLPRWTVLADPEGNEFCVFARTRSANV